MEILDKDFKLEMVPMWKIIFIASSEDACCEWYRTIIADDFPEFGLTTVIEGGHCSCYDFEDTKWEATSYTREEMHSLLLGWAKECEPYKNALADQLRRYRRWKRDTMQPYKLTQWVESLSTEELHAELLGVDDELAGEYSEWAAQKEREAIFAELQKRN